ncbi:MAG TPA: DUF6519 domain-containing protein, partial [Longimicrobium sp.]|nr:DUF6519 domain-containing protein [Longimicrobium sp.]
MTFDISRFRFSPAKDYLGVVMQQGRVQLESDWNEWVLQLVRRIQAGTLDTVGRAVVPRETPDAFRIQVTGGQLTIGPGRMYVDGLLAENHGPIPHTTWDPRLAELRGTGDLANALQPHYPGAPALPAGGPHLVYLDVWQREVTHLHDRSLVEPAVGVDTTGRLQTVWQVKVLPNVGSTACATPDGAVPGWAAATAPSAGRLTTGTAPVTTPPDPCHVPPAGGYKGLENQLYRVEIHDGGPVGQATFKWSRDNGAVATAVRRITGPNQLVVESVGRDAVLRFNNGDWVEVTDDVRELQGLPGDLRRIRLVKGVDDATRTITLDAPLTPGRFPTDPNDIPVAATRVRRWDQRGKVFKADGTTVVVDLDAAGATGAIPVPATKTDLLLLENGVVVSFDLDPAGGHFHTADAWAFAARTADASVEVLQAAPPLGIHHHYARLALVTPTQVLEDCRVHWPPECGDGGGCCTQVVRPGQDIQAAIDRLPAVGGCVCLKPGVHVVRAPLRIERSHVTLHGETAGAVVRRAEGGPVVVRIGGRQGETIDDVALHDLRLEAGGRGDAVDAIVHVHAAAGVSVRDCEMAPADPAATLLFAIGVAAAQASQLAVERCTFWNLAAGVAAMTSGAVTVADCRFLGPAETGDDATFSRGVRGVWLLDDTVGPNHVVRNEFQHYHEAVVIGREAVPTVVEDNRVFRDGRLYPPDFPTVEAVGALLNGVHFPNLRSGYAIASRAPGCVIARNAIRLTDAGQKGILVSGSGSMVRENRIEAELELPDVPRAEGVPLGVVLAIDVDDWEAEKSLRECSVVENRVSGPVGAILVAGYAAEVTVAGNHISGDRLRYEELIPSPGDVPTWTQVENIVSSRFFLGWGILMHISNDSLVSGNHVDNTLAGVFLANCIDTTVHDNRLVACIGGVYCLGGYFLSVTHNAVASVFAIGMGGERVNTSAFEGNVVRSSFGAGIYLLFGVGNTVSGNEVEGGGFGIALLTNDRTVVQGNRVAEVMRTGIVACNCGGGLVIRENRVHFCGSAGGRVARVFGRPEEPPGGSIDAATGIAVVNCAGEVEIDGCEVRETGNRVPGDTSFVGIRYGILADLVERVRVHGCTVSNPQPPAVRYDSTVLRVNCNRAASGPSPWGGQLTD